MLSGTPSFPVLLAQRVTRETDYPQPRFLQEPERAYTTGLLRLNFTGPEQTVLGFPQRFAEHSLGSCDSPGRHRIHNSPETDSTGLVMHITAAIDTRN